VYWFRSRRPERKSSRLERRFSIEELEDRVSAVTWFSNPVIDVTNILVDGAIITPGLIYVANGDSLNLSLMGTCEDWDTWVGQDPNTGTMTGGQEQEELTASWSFGATGCSVSYQLPTTPDYVTITVTVDDAASAEGRNDEAIVMNWNFTAIWVTIALNAYGPMDDDDEVLKAFEPRGLGQFGLSGGGAGEHPGIFHRVELVGTIAPEVPDQTGLFRWKQTADLRSCNLNSDGTISGAGDFRAEAREGPVGGAYTVRSKNSKTFMIDAPGVRDIGAQGVAAKNYYVNLTTYVDFNTKKASADFTWHVWATLRSSGGGGWEVETSQIGVGVGHLSDLPPAVEQIPQDGSYAIDCSNEIF